MPRSIPVPVYMISLAIFAQGTSEFMLSGLLPDIAADLGVSVPRAGLLTSAFAIGLATGAPLLAIASLRWPRRRALLVFLAAFVVTHAVGALLPDYTILLVTRLLGAFAYAGFWAVAAVTAVSLVPSDLKGRAMSIVAGGLTIATVAGVPAGTLLGQQLGWQATVWAVAGMTALSAIGVAATVPDGREPVAPRGAWRRELHTLTNARLWLTYLTSALSTGTAVAVQTYLAALLITVSGIASGWVPVVLVAFGAGSFAGVTVGGRFADANPFGTLAIGFTGAGIAAVTLASAAQYPAVAIAAATVLAACSFATNPALQVRVFTLAGQAPTLAAASNITGFNVGIMLAPAIGGALIAAGWGVGAVAWVSATLAAAGIAVTGWSYTLRHNDYTDNDPAAARTEAVAA